MESRNIAKIKEVLRLTTNNEVALLEQKGIIPKPKRGAHNLENCARQYIVYLKEQHTVLQTKYEKITAERWVVTTKDAAEFLGVQNFAILKDIREHGAPKLGTNRIDLTAYVKWKIERAKDTGRGGRPADADAQALELTFQKTRYATVQADIAERDSVTINDATEALHGLAGIVIGALTAQRGRLAGILAPITDPAHVSAKLREEELSLRDQIANKIREFAAIGGNGSGDDSATPEPIPGRMDSGKQGSAER